MSNVFYMNLRSDPFDRMADGDKNVEYRLNDKKHRALKELDYMRIFVLRNR